eukprot:1245589-Amphidinium_carterae.1
MQEHCPKSGRSSHSSHGLPQQFCQYTCLQHNVFLRDAPEETRSTLKRTGACAAQKTKSLKMFEVSFQHFIRDTLPYEM